MRSKGDEGEEIARGVLERAGYFVVTNNFCIRGGEIDIVARAPDGCVVFIEVKLRTHEPEDHRSLLPHKKIVALRRAAHIYSMRNKIVISRFDLLLIVRSPGSRLKRIIWYKQAC